MRKYIKTLVSLKDNDEGSVLIMFVAFILVIFAIGGAGVDFGRGQLVKMKAQQASDLAALAGANPAKANPTAADRLTSATLYYNLNFPEKYLGVERPAMNHGGDNTLNFSVDGKANVTTNFIRTIGQNSLNVYAGSKANIETKNPKYDVILVLDISDSMDWKFDGTKCTSTATSPCNNNDGNTATSGYPYCFTPSANYYSCGVNSRLTALKTAAKSLTNILLAPEVIDNNRIAVVTWNNILRNTLSFSNNRSTIINFINNMQAYNSTNSTAGLTKAKEFAQSFQESAIHAVVLLTDGENNGGSVSHDQSIDDSSLAICQELKNMNPATLIYTIALGNAMEKDSYGNFAHTEGFAIDQFLRKCASGTSAENDNKYYFIAPSSDKLNNIFTTIANNLQKLRITD